jgi:hypothetical protein
LTVRDKKATRARDEVEAIIRLVDLDCAMAFVVCHSPRGRKWFARAPSIPRSWFPRGDLDARSFAFGVQFGKRSDDLALRKINADAWFDRADAGRFTVREQTTRVSRDETISLVLVEDKRMLDE